jgi:hypothetical protein
MVIDLDISSAVGDDISLDLESQLRVSHRVHRGDELSLLLQLPSDVAPSHGFESTGVTYSGDPALSLGGAAVVRWEHDGAHRREGRTLMLALSAGLAMACSSACRL